MTGKSSYQPHQGFEACYKEESAFQKYKHHKGEFSALSPSLPPSPYFLSSFLGQQKRARNGFDIA